MIDPMQATFKDYQAQYETYLPIPLRKALNCVQVRVCSFVTVVDEYVQIPDLLIRTTQLVVAILSFSPTLGAYLVRTKQFCKDAKNFTNFAQGMKSMSGFLNFKWILRDIIFNVSGLTLFTLSGLSLIERFNILNLTSLKVRLMMIPIFGILPWGGLFVFSATGLMGMIILLGCEKRIKLLKQESRIIKEKLVFWSQPLDLSEVQERFKKSQSKVIDLKDQIATYQQLIQEGKRIEQEVLLNATSVKRVLYTCQKALDELQKALANKEEELRKCKETMSHWEHLEKDWTQIKFQELENFRKAKQDKWQAKLNKLQAEKRNNLISLVSCIIVLTRQALIIVSVALGYGVIALPLLVNTGLDVIVVGSGITSFLMKKSIKRMQVPSVPLNLAIS